MAMLASYLSQVERVSVRLTNSSSSIASWQAASLPKVVSLPARYLVCNKYYHPVRVGMSRAWFMFTLIAFAVIVTASVWWIADHA